jgi:hypothetical protein
MNYFPEKLRNIRCKVKEKQSLMMVHSYLNTQYFVIFLEYGSCPIMNLFTSNSEKTSSSTCNFEISSLSRCFAPLFSATLHWKHCQFIAKADFFDT